MQCGGGESRIPAVRLPLPVIVFGAQSGEHACPHFQRSVDLVHDELEDVSFRTLLDLQVVVHGPGDDKGIKVDTRSAPPKEYRNPLTGSWVALFMFLKLL